MFADFTKISTHFFNEFYITNYDLLKGLVEKNNIIQQKNVRTQPCISIRTGIIPCSEADTENRNYDTAGIMHQEPKDIMGFSVVIMINSGKKETTQEALNITATIAQRVKYIIEKPEFSDFDKIDDIDCRITSIEESSNIVIDEANSEYVLHLFVVKGIYKTIFRPFS